VKWRQCTKRKQANRARRRLPLQLRPPPLLPLIRHLTDAAVDKLRSYFFGDSDQPILAPSRKPVKMAITVYRLPITKSSITKFFHCLLNSPRSVL
jgi:hypothetical protein